MPQFQNAILGGQVDYSQFQPTQLEQPDFSFMQGQQFEAPDPFDPFYGMTNDQIQNATATQPPSPFPFAPHLGGTIYNPQNNQANMPGAGYGRKNLMRYR